MRTFQEPAERIAHGELIGHQRHLGQDDVYADERAQRNEHAQEGDEAQQPDAERADGQHDRQHDQDDSGQDPGQPEHDTHTEQLPEVGGTQPEGLSQRHRTAVLDLVEPGDQAALADDAQDEKDQPQHEDDQAGDNGDHDPRLGRDRFEPLLELLEAGIGLAAELVARP